MDFTTSILRRSAREKTVRRKDGTEKKITIKGGFFFRIRYVDLDGRPRTIERGPFKLKSHARDEMNAVLPGLRHTRGRSREAEGMTFNELADLAMEKLFHQPEYVPDIDGNRSEFLVLSRGRQSGRR